MSKIMEEVDINFLTKCSDITLFSNPKGFFRSLAEEILEIANKDDWLYSVFDHRNGDTAKLSAVLENKEITEALDEIFSRIQTLHRKKDGKVSQVKLAESVESMKDGNLRKALALASQAVLKAPLPDDPDCLDGVFLSLALWQRSEILMKMKKENLALEDLKMALKERLPAKMRPRYYWRIGHCYKATGDFTRAKVSYELALRLIGNDESTKRDIARDIASLEGAKFEPIVPKELDEIKLAGGPKINLPSMSKYVKIAEEENKGRFAVADVPIKTGDILLYEKPYASCLVPDNYGTHCLHCFKRLEAPVGCSKCSGVAFCSSQCRDTAMVTYHRYECPLMDLFVGSGMSLLTYIALRMITQAGLETSISIHNKYLSAKVKTVESVLLNNIEGNAKKGKMKNRKDRLSRNKRGPNGQIVLDDDANKSFNNENNDTMTDNIQEQLELTAAQIYSQCTHSEYRKPEDYLKKIIMSMFLKECLKKIGFFKKPVDIEQDEFHILELLLRNLQILQFNAHEINETLQGNHTFNRSKSNYIAVGIYPTGALFNHECYPAVARYFDGKRIVLRATRSLFPGEVVAENYGLNFLNKPADVRRRHLAGRYWFTCYCPACTENWPTLKAINDQTLWLRCTTSSCPYKFKVDINNLPKHCPKCSNLLPENTLKHNIEVANHCVKMYQEGANLMEEEKPLEAIAVLKEAVDMFQAVASPPHKTTHLAQESLRCCYACFRNVHNVEADME